MIQVLTGMRSGVEFKYLVNTFGRYQSWFYFTDPRFREPKLADIWLRFRTTNVAINTEVPLVDLDAFINGVGGALGLFLGFSIIDSLMVVYSYCNKFLK